MLEKESIGSANTENPCHSKLTARDQIFGYQTVLIQVSWYLMDGLLKQGKYVSFSPIHLKMLQVKTSDRLAELNLIHEYH